LKIILDRLAALWPFIGIVVEILLVVLLIILGEIKRRKSNKVIESKSQ
jgi:hypothetical protein